jgi:hypothetical protein
MIIRDLKEKYPLVYDAALKNQVEQGNVADDSQLANAIALVGGFNWKETEEGFDFWEHVCNSEFTSAKEICPHLFNKTTKKGWSYRINNIEFRPYKGKENEPLYEIVKWFPDQHYGKRQEYIDSGYKELDAYISNSGLSIDNSCFLSPESCYVIAFIRLDKDEYCISIDMVGDKILELIPSEYLNFRSVLEWGNNKISKKYFKKED